MLCWGNNVNGELGLGGLEEEHIDLPRSQQSSLAWEIEDIGCGPRHTFYLQTNGSVYSSGMNDYGQLGHDKSRVRPERVDALQAHVIKRIACGACHTLAVNEWGQVFAWGSDEKGQCGLGAESMRNVVKMVKSLATKTVVQIACGAYHSMALTNTGELYAWGSNEHGQLGIGSKDSFVSKPVCVSSLKGVPIAFIACGNNHSFAVSKSGAVYGWGKNAFGQLGMGTTDDRLFPTQLKSLRHLRVTYVSCGCEHTAVLTQDGGVFTFGAGMYGQLGHGTNSNELTPKKVLELMGSTVTQVACGRYHTLAYVPSRGRVYSFGLGGSGQLGVKSKTNVNSPHVVLGPWVSPGGVAAMEVDQPPAPNGSISKDMPVYVRKIFCGGDQSFTLVAPYINSFQPSDYRVRPSDASILYLNSDKVKAIRMVGPTESADDELLSYVEAVFSNTACMCSSFLRADDSHFGCSSRNHGIDLELAADAFSQISRVQNSSFSDLIFDCFTKELIPKLPSSPPDVEVMRVFLILPLYHEFLHAKHYSMLQLPFALAILKMPSPASKVLDNWWASVNSDYLLRLVESYKRIVVHVLSSLTAADSDERKIEPLKLCLEVLRKLNLVNKNLAGQKISYEAFYIPEVTERINVKNDYVNWLADFASAKPRGFHFCSYPFVFDSQAKTLLLQTDQAIQMQTAMNEAASRALSFMDPQAIQFLVLNVSRTNLVRDTISQLSAYGTSDLKKPLKVKFKNEEADDAGGVRKEFLMLLIKEILDPNYGMFKVYEETHAIWFSEHSFEREETFFLIGLLCGLAIYNFTIINLPFPSVLYKKLLNEVVRLDDLAGLSPTMLRSLHSLLEYDEDKVEDVFCLNFAVTTEVFGEIKSVLLKPGGEDIVVTQRNKQEYVDLYVDYLLNKSIDNQFKAFNTGLHKVCGGRVLELFQAHELMELVTGNENYDWYELEKNAEYKNGFCANDPTIRYFWEVFHELPLEQKKKFLLFLTGSDRVPILGMKAIKVVIQKIACGENFLPVAHTCFNLLDLPLYQTKERLKYKLLQAIQQSQGFALA